MYKVVASGKLLYKTGSPAYFCDDLDGWDGVTGESIYTLMSDSFCCTAETNKMLYSNFPLINF